MERRQYTCPDCFVALSERQPVCPNCGKPNPYYGQAASKPHEGDATRPSGNAHHPSATAGKCAYCEATVFSDEKTCPQCGAANPGFVVHGGTAAAGGTRAHGTANASTGKCPYCGATVRSNERFCSNCGSENAQYTEDTVRVILEPKTIEELKEYCAERNMPLLRMRFFIGEDIQGPKAYGIFRNSSGEVVVYKNKADGSRAIRYRGTDERRAVKEILAKLHEECRARGINPDRSLNGDGAGYAPQDSALQSQPRPSVQGKGARAKKTAKTVLRTLATILILLLVLGTLFGRFMRCTCSLVSCVSSAAGYSYDFGNDWDSGFWDWGDSDSDWDWGSDSDSDWDDWDWGDSDWDSDW